MESHLSGSTSTPNKLRSPHSVGYKICNVCGQSVIINHLKNHARVKHLKAPVAQCPQCGHEELWHVSNMRKHIREVHSESDGEPIVIPIDKDTVKMWKDKCFLGASEGSPTPRHSRTTKRRSSKAIKNELHDIDLDASDDLNEDNMNNSLPLKKRKLSGTDAPASPEDRKGLPNKMEGMLVCADCHAIVPPDRAEMHVRTQHLRQPMYKCSQCKFSTMWYEQHVQQHIDKYHQGNEANIVTLPSDESTFQLLMDSCFPQTLQCHSAFEDEYAQASQSGTQKEEDTKNPNSNSIHAYMHQTQGNDAAVSASAVPKYCLLCSKDVQDSRRHVWQIHMKKRVFRCGHTKCNFATDDPPSKVILHWYTVHLPDSMPKVTDTRKQHMEEFMKMWQACFLNKKPEIELCEDSHV